MMPVRRGDPVSGSKRGWALQAKKYDESYKKPESRGCKKIPGTELTCTPEARRGTSRYVTSWRRLLQLRRNRQLIEASIHHNMDANGPGR